MTRKKKILLAFVAFVLMIVSGYIVLAFTTLAQIGQAIPLSLNLRFGALTPRLPMPLYVIEQDTIARVTDHEWMLDSLTGKNSLDLFMAKWIGNAEDKNKTEGKMATIDIPGDGTMAIRLLPRDTSRKKMQGILFFQRTGTRVPIY